jgi:hypothetical protein
MKLKKGRNKKHVMKKILTFLKRKELYLGIIRYILGLWMLTYGLTKILRTQFVVLPFAIWQRPLESLSGKNIAWAFLGYSPWFQILLGVLEFIPSILLLFRRTTFLGAILLFPMILNVFIINHALDLWDATKQISLILLVLNCLVLIFYWATIKLIISKIIQLSVPLKKIWLEVILNIIIISFVMYPSLTDLLDYKSRTNFLTGDWYNGHPNEWILQSEKINDSILKPRLLKRYFGAYGEYSEINDTGFVKRGGMEYSLNEKSHVLEFSKPDESLKNIFQFIITDSTLELHKMVESSNNQKLIQVFKRRVINGNKK